MVLPIIATLDTTAHKPTRTCVVHHLTMWNGQKCLNHFKVCSGVGNVGEMGWSSSLMWAHNLTPSPPYSPTVLQIFIPHHTPSLPLSCLFLAYPYPPITFLLIPFYNSLLLHNPTLHPTLPYPSPFPLKPNLTPMLPISIVLHMHAEPLIQATQLG